MAFDPETVPRYWLGVGNLHREEMVSGKDFDTILAISCTILDALKELAKEESRDDDDPILGMARVKAREAIAKAEAMGLKAS